jgi:putative transposase
MRSGTGVGSEPEHSCLLVIIGAREDGRKELLAMELGYRESTASWIEVLRALRAASRVVY